VEKWPATGFSGGRRRWPWRLGETRLGGLAAGQLVSARATLEPRGATGVDGRQRARGVGSSTERRRQWRGKHAVVRGGGASGFYMRLGTPVGDGG
jgi:hypothetical protein